MKILIVGMPNSIHLARFISQINNIGWDIHLFPSNYGLLHPTITDVKLWWNIYYKRPHRNEHFDKRNIKFKKSINLFFGRPAYHLNRAVNFASRYINFYPYLLSKTIKTLKPDIIHSHEFQHAGYLTLAAKKLLKGNFPKWLLTNWGNDIYHFQQFPEHREKIKELLKECDYYSCECYRDVVLARKFGYKGKVAGVFSNPGGFNLKKAQKLRFIVKPSERRTIMVKGYQGWQGRALVAFKAIEKCADLLKNYRIMVYLVSSTEVKRETERLADLYNLDIEMVPYTTSHDYMLKLHSRSRLHIGINITDGASISCLEAITMGSFPVQSYTACADEWVTDGETGFLVPPEDPDEIAKAIKKAVTDDELVNKAAEKNWQTVKEKLDFDVLKQKTINMYKSIFEDNR